MSATTEASAPTRVMLVGICIIAGATFVVLASYNYMLPSMLDDLDLTSEQGNLALKIPSLGALLVVFVAGRLGDRLGHRRVILVAGVFFIIGCLVVAAAQNLAMVSIGMFLEGVSATAIQIIVIGFIAARFVEPKARTAAYATYGMAYPTVYLIFPVVAGWMVTYVSWRAIPALWALGGVALILIAWFALPTSFPKPVGEVWTPILAGLVAVGIVQFISHASDYGILSWLAIASAAMAVAALLLCMYLLRRLKNPSLSITPLKNGATTILLVVVLLVPTLNTFFYVTVALQYMYGYSSFQTALIMVPAQVASILGAKFLSERLTVRFGIKRTGVVLLLVLAGVMAIPLTFSAETPLLWLMTFTCAYGGVVTAVAVVVLNALMGTAPPEEGGNTAAYQGSAEEVGIALGTVLMSALVFGVGQFSLQSRLENSGLDSTEAAVVIEDLQANSGSPELAAAYSYPLPDGSDASDEQRAAIADGLRVNGAAGVVVALLAAGLFAVHRRELGDDPAAYEEESSSA